MNARKVALDCLYQVMVEKKYANLILRERLEKVELKNRGFITQLVYGTLRNYRYCRFQWSHFAKRKVSDQTAILIDMSVYQLLMMDNVPEYAVVNEAVELSSHSQKGFVNAILHKVMKQKIVCPEDFAIETSHPEWIYKLWCAHYGEEIAKKICSSNQEEAEVQGRLNTLMMTKEELQQEEGIQFLDDVAFTADFNLIHHPYFQEGKVIIQDYSSQQVVRYLDAQPGMRVLDCCAAPGTKTSQIAMEMKNSGVILAGDIHEHRVKLLEQLMTKLHVEIVQGKVWDATQLDKELSGEKFDRILADVPCSGLGVLKRKPEIKWTCTPDGLDEIVSLQYQILKSVGGLVKPQGILVYSTCTLNKKENEKQIERFLKENEDFECIEEKTIFPFDSHGDGFYIAKMIKKA